MTYFTNKFSLAAASLLGLTLLSVPAIAQSGQDATNPKAAPRPMAKPELRIVPQDTLIGAAVSNGLPGDKQKSLGSVSDLVIDGADGKVRYAVVASGGTLGIGKKLTVVPWRSLAWDAEASCFNLGMTPDALEHMPVFDPAKVGALGAAEATEVRGERGHATGQEAGKSKGEHTDGAAAGVQGPATLVLVSKLGGCDVLAYADKLGSGVKTFIEPVSGSTAFLSVAAGGVLGIGETNYVVPWAAAKLVTPLGKDAIEIQIDRAKSGFEAAPKLGDEGADLNRTEFRHKVYEFYGVERPAFEPKDPRPAGKAIGQTKRERGQ